MNFDKYNPLKQPKPRLQDWKDSVSVILLSEYLKTKKEFGIRLCQDEGELCLHFTPGFQADAIGSERWTVAEIAASLFLEAADDLKELIRNGKLDLPSRDSLDNKNGAGPSGMSQFTRVAKPQSSNTFRV